MHEPDLPYADVIAELTIEEKVALTSGANFWNTTPIPRLGIPSVMLTDGPHGVRKQGGAADHLGINASLPATCFPTAAALANSWDSELAEEVGRALGREARAYDVGVLLGPGLNLKRDPRGGRNFEYFSEDPYLSGTLAAAMIRGIESTGVSACPKHFAVNSQETYRMSIDESVDERALRELYLEGFRIAVQEGRPRTIMSSYNKINGTFAHENADLLQQVLREEWGFDGMVVSDWGGTHNRVPSIVAGGSLEMPSTSGFTNTDVIRALERGDLAESDLDARVSEVLGLVMAAPAPDGSAVTGILDKHRSLARKAAAESIVMLKNTGAVLPLGRSSGKVAVIGDFAATPRFQGSGSSRVNPHALTSALPALHEAGVAVSGYAPGFHRTDRPSTRRLREAVELAERSDVIIAFLGLNESAEAEGFDRDHMRLPRNQLRMLRALVDTGRPIVVVLAGGAPVELPFEPSVAAIVHGYLPGQEGGDALADVLTGAVNPAGRLAESYPMHYRDAPASPWFAQGEVRADHRESIYVGYRYYDKAGLQVRYPFGHGLSYTSFEYSDLVVHGTTAAVTVTNAGARDGDEVVQVYVEPVGALGFRSAQELAGFSRVHVPAGQSARVEVPLREHAFSVYDVESNGWQVRPGGYILAAAASSRDHRARINVQVAAEEGDGFMLTQSAGPAPGAGKGPGEEISGLAHLPQAVRAPYLTGRVHEVGDSAFSSLLGRRLPPNCWDTSQPLTGADLIAQGARRKGLARLIFQGGHAVARILRMIGRPLDANNAVLVLDFPYHALSRMSGGRVSPAMLDDILLIANRRAWRGACSLARDWFTHVTESRRP